MADRFKVLERRVIVYLASVHHYGWQIAPNAAQAGKQAQIEKQARDIIAIVHAHDPEFIRMARLRGTGEPEDKHQCPYCRFGFLSAHVLRIHIRQKHGEDSLPPLPPLPDGFGPLR